MTVGSRVLLLLAFGASACDQVTRLEGDAAEECVPTAVQAAFDRSCARGGCHDAATGSAGLVLSAPASADVLLRTASQMPMPLVTIGAPEQSYVAQKLSTDPSTEIVGAPMPVGFDAGNAEQTEDVAIILGWIAGAQLPGCEAGETTGGVDETTGAESSTGGETSGASATDLPCEIDDLLDRRCRSCHADPPRAAPMPLVTRDDLVAASLVDPMLTFAERALVRIGDANAPMPPSPGAPVTAEERALLEAWIADGMPAGSCGPSEPDPFDVEPQCTSERFWEDEEEDSRMHPGRDCIACHDLEREDRPGDDDIPDLLVAGTVFPTGHEPNECWGYTSADLRVVVRSLATDEVVELATNGTGNFLLHRGDAPAGFVPPFAIKLVEGDRERIMAMPAPLGACNGCHTQDGAMNAPGRIVAP